MNKIQVWLVYWKEIDTIEGLKECTHCKNEFPATTKYFYRQKTKDGLSPWCKKCRKEYQKDYQNKNRDKVISYVTQTHQENKEEYLQYQSTYGKNNRENGRNRFYKFCNKNPDKIKKYRVKRELTKTHIITEQEWQNCKNFFNYECAYCGLSEKEHYKLFNQQLHKDHAINDGNNTIDNCLPCCKSCNSGKRKKDWDIWYNQKNQKYDAGRLNKIVEWLKLNNNEYNVI